MALITIKIERRTRTSEAGTRRRAARWLLAVGAGVAALVGAFVVSIPGAQAGVVSIPAKTIANNVAVAAHGTLALVSIGADTTVPTNATRVQFAVIITGATANGTVNANPTGVFPGSGDLVHYTSATSTGTINERVGLGNQVTFHNNGTSGINLTVKITGYSTEVRATDIVGTGGTAGQVLTNTGAGAAWQSVGHAYGVANPFTVQGLTTGLTTVASVTVPAGNYVVNFNTTIAGSSSASPDNVGCFLFSPTGSELVAAYGNTYSTDDQSVITAQGLVSGSAGGTITAQCVDSNSTASVFYPTLIANSVGAVDGYSGAAPVRHKSRPTGPDAAQK